VAAIHAAHGQGQHGADENAEGVQDDAGRKTREGREEGMSSLMEVIANVSAGIDRKADTGAAAHLSEVTALPLSASHNLVMPSAV
jgi:hypothetical protein